MSRRRAAIDVVVAAASGFAVFYAWSMLSVFVLLNFWLPETETHVALSRSIGFTTATPIHVAKYVVDVLLAAVLGFVVGFGLGRLLSIGSRAFVIAVGFGLALALLVTIATGDVLETTIWLLRQAGLWMLPISAWLGFAYASQKRTMRNAA